ncbi:prolyl oligopeptidase family serine peptidase [Pedobacter petrophilus]|uniref:Prolyl oligopeptidase family serine peptidase n=1 Tax=Pedobacter petrophilus TaxID=1908241 RepID=A0A7K0FY23_9SPHI|nr:prolyl oligopeptidase family serine peptidase [Pedobacter petrophilus]MRX75964.1 prolyl oligopeptidase family serine peptidase [Pedobacter petrophilus]
MQKRLTIILFFVVSFAYAQKKPLDHTVYDTWESVGAKQLSNNGTWAMYGVLQQEGDAQLSISNLKTSAKINVPRGMNAQFSNDSKFAAFTIRPFNKDLRQAKIKKKKPEEMPKDSLGITNLSTSAVTKISRVKSFKFPEEGSGVMAYLTDKPDTAKKAVTPAEKKDTDADFLADEPALKGKTEEGTDLVVKNLTTGTDRTFKFVIDYAFSKDGKQLVFSCSGSKKDKTAPQGVYLLNTEKGILKTLIKGKGSFKNFAFDEESEHLAFVGGQSPEKQEIKNYNVYYNSLTLDTAQIIVDFDMPGLPAKWSVNGDAKVTFSKDGKKLFFGISPVKASKDTTIVDFEVAKVDVWNYKDDYLQPMQLKNADRDSKKSYLSVIDVYSSDPKVIPLTDLTLPDANLIAEGNSNAVLATTDYGHRIESQWSGSTSKDYYLVDTKTGQRKKIIAELNGYAMASPGGNYVLYFDRKSGNWYTYNVATSKATALTERLNVKFVEEDNDVPDLPSAYGIATWTADDKAVILNDRYDLWSFSPDGKSEPKNITAGFGRANKITFRYERLSAENRFDRNADNKFVKSNELVWLNGFNNATKENGFYRTNVGTVKAPELVVMSKHKYSNLVKAEAADIYIYDKASYVESPNVYVTTDFKTETKLTNTNPQQQNYNWGTAELVKWTTPKGYQAEGILYKPENFDPNKKYPMIAYFYEKLTDGLYNYQAPAPTPSRLNISFFVSNGYLVFAPDISYENGHPGQSAVEYINSGVENLKKNNWVDAKKIGIQGQSWGGYQVAYLITQNDMYAAAWAGAPVVNMTSAYGGIRWETGMNRQFQYEKTQSRIGATLWEKPELYIENSPLFMFPKVNTPVVVMANDADGAVPWYQGIEMFTGLRRLGKPVWMLNYNGEAHNLVQRQNRKDIQIREQQFFDYYLKGAKAPAWMTSGIPATEKGKTWGFELTDGKP